MRSELDRSAEIVADEFGSACTYFPAAGGSIDLLAVMTYATEVIGSSNAFERRDIADVRQADVAQPVEGDTALVDGIVYQVDSFLESGSLWRLILRKTS